MLQTDCFFCDSVACRKEISDEIRYPGILFVESLESGFADVSQRQCFLQERADIYVVVCADAVIRRAAASIE
jgi:hypothetical protein